MIRMLKVESCVTALCSLSLSELNEVADRLVAADADVADQLEFAIGTVFQEQSNEVPA